MALEWREAAERMDVYLKELLSSGLLLLHAELGVDVGLKAELLPPGLLACVAAGLGLLLAALLWFFVCRCFSKNPAEKVAPEAGKTSKPKSEEVKKRSRKRGGDKKVQRNGLAVDLEEEPKPAEAQNQNQSESPDPAGGKSDKGKKNKKKAKAAVKETKSPSTSVRKEPEEGTWETKVSHREKRQQRRKDKGAGDESGSPGGTEPGANAANTEHHAPAVEEAKIILAPSVTSKTSSKTTTNTKSSNTNTTNTKTSNTTTNNTKTSTTTTTNTKTSNTTTTNTKISPKNTKSNNAPVPKAQKNSQRTQQAPPPVELSHAWDVMAVNGSGSWDLGVSVPPHTQTWNSVKSEPSVWPQDMEGSWMIVDGSHIPVSLHEMTAGVGEQVVPERSWACPVPVDDEWSGPNSGSADPASDYCAPCEEWGNYDDPAGGAVSPDEPQFTQDSDLEKDKDEPAAPGSSKAKKKKKKKKKAEEAGSAAQVEVEVGVAKDQNTAGNILPKIIKEPEIVVSPRVPLKPPTEPDAPPKSTAPPTQKKPEESWESPKQVKKKKVRRET
ncbi:protein LYRIC [Ictalurus furcatus]|uniref:protein LYRIC n=1 Tax=Ictalurus furcatus TaxID=66913 RepID=UPI00234FFFFD|nr:protein LYRIC [Ictalurus furcatus]XP_053467053.1 protein LYRIC [Ictalurus furcatus]